MLTVRAHRVIQEDDLTFHSDAVLANKKTDEPVKKGKGYKDAQWEAEVRKSLANKKSTGPAILSKQEQALVQAQLEKESAIRANVEQIKSRLARGLSLVNSLATAQVELHAFMSTIVDVLLKGAFSATAVVLVEFKAFETYMVRRNGICLPSCYDADLSRRLSHCVALTVSTRTEDGLVLRSCARWKSRVYQKRC